MKKFFKYGLLAVLLVGCENNNKDNVDEQAQSGKGKCARKSGKCSVECIDCPK